MYLKIVIVLASQEATRALLVGTIRPAYIMGSESESLGKLPSRTLQYDGEGSKMSRTLGPIGPGPTTER